LGGTETSLLIFIYESDTQEDRTIGWDIDIDIESLGEVHRIEGVGLQKVTRHTVDLARSFKAGGKVTWAS